MINTGRLRAGKEGSLLCDIFITSYERLSRFWRERLFKKHLCCKESQCTVCFFLHYKSVTFQMLNVLCIILKDFEKCAFLKKTDVIQKQLYPCLRRAGGIFALVLVVKKIHYVNLQVLNR